MALDPSGNGITYEDIVLDKQINMFCKDEVFLDKFMELYTKLEQKFADELKIMDK